MFQDTSHCNRFTEEQTEVKAAFLAKYNESIDYVTKYVTNQTGSSVSGTFGMVTIWDTFYSIVSNICLSVPYTPSYMLSGLPLVVNSTGDL